MTKFFHQPNRRFVILPGLLMALVAALCLTTQSALGQTNVATYKLDLATLGYSTATLAGPSGNVHYYFSLPANWTPQAGSSLGLDLGYTVSGKTSMALAQLEVRLNNKLLHTESFSNTTITTSKIDIPPEALRLAEDPYSNDLELRLLVRAECEDALLTTLTVESTSAFDFVYQERPLPLDLAFYPKPLYYSRAFDAAPDRIVLPSQPNVGELTSAAMLAANLGARTYNNLILEASLGPTLPATATQQHLIVIGAPGRATLLSQLSLPLPVRQRQMDLRSEMPAAVTALAPFSYTLIVKNTSATSQSLAIEDRLSPPASPQACPLCSQVQPGLLRWDVGVLEAGQSVSATVQASLDPALGVGDSIEHTASLLDASGQVINVDTLTATVAPQANETPVSSSIKGLYFFALDNQGVPENDGIVQMVVSPWTARRAVVAVTGLDDAAVLRAAYALAASNKMPGMQGQFAIVQAVRPVTAALNSSAQAQSSQDVTLADLGYSDIVNVGRAAQIRLSFEVPPGTKLTEAAYLATHWTHGTALSAISGTLELSLNATPVNSIELRPDNEGDNWTRASLPARLLKPGVNELSLQLTATRWPACLDEEALARFWATVYADSYLHLPFEPAAGPSAVLDLADYPRFLVTQPDLGDVAVLFPGQVTSDDVQGMVRLFSFLGDVTRNDYFVPQVALGNQVEPERWRGDQLVVIGRPTQNPYIAWVNDRLPQPFLPGQDEIRQQVDNVIFRWPRGLDLGYIQLLPVPGADQRAMLVVTGTTDQGLRWALRSLVDSTLNRQLSGNLAVLTNETEMHTADTRPATERKPQWIAVQLTPAPTATPGATLPLTNTALLATPQPTAAPDPIPTSASSVFPSPAVDEATEVPGPTRPFWVMPLLGLSLFVVIVAVGVAIWQARA
jgi:hypothetical protein